MKTAENVILPIGIWRLDERSCGMEKATIEVYRYRDHKGRPTCAANFFESEICDFLLQSKLGTRNHCIFDANHDSKTGFNDIGHYNEDFRESLKPCESCPVWHNNIRSDESCQKSSR